MKLHSIFGLLCLALLSITTVSAITVDQLIDTYDYGFSNGSINVTNSSDYMRDLDSDGVNDTLIINLTTNAGSSTRYYFIVELIGNQSLISNYTNVTVNSSSPNAWVSFDTRLLDRGQYNYTVRVRDMAFGLVFVKYKTQTQSYTNYRRGTSVLSVTDQNNANSTLRFTVNLNVTKNETVNVTVHLSYDNSTISGSKNIALTTPTQAVTIDIGNETMKSTHRSGTYQIKAIQIGTKNIASNQTIGSYNYEDFAKTSYIKSISSAAIENNSNNLSEALRFNVTIVVKHTATYTVELVLANEEGDPLVRMTKNQSLSVGTQIMQLELNGSDAYRLYFSGALRVVVATLTNSTATVDSVANAHTTSSYQYSDFEPPARPDIVLTINVSRNATTSNVTILARNIGTAPAFNVVIDVFDNGTYENQTALPQLAVGTNGTVSFLLPNAPFNQFVAIADFENTIDESNESNNVATTIVASLNITLIDLSPNASDKTFRVVIKNNGTADLSNLTWTVLFGDGTNTTSNVTLGLNQSVNVSAQHVYANGSYQATAIVTNDLISTSMSISFNVTNGSAQSNASRLSVSLISPSTNTNVTRNALSAFTVQACCIQGSCGTVNVTLDPETVERTYTSERRCIDGVCDVSLFSAPRFGFEDNIWKPLEELHSFIGTVPISCRVASDRHHLVECLEYNATHRQLRVSLASGTGVVPFRVLDRRGIERSNTTVTLTTTGQEAIITVPVNLVDDLHVGATSTNITLLPNTTSVDGWWEVTGNSSAMYNWTNCDANAYSGSDKNQISVNSTSSKIYGSAGGTSTQFSVCHRIKWDINTTPANVTALWVYAYWGGEPHNGSDSQAKALYLGNASSQSWIELDRKNNTFGAQHTGIASSGLTSIIENVSGHAYVYTILHMNATKASSSNGAYSEFYYTELRLTVGASNATGPKGTVSNVSGTIPFYVNSTNPRQISLSTNQCENVTWYVNATGTENATYTFFAYANLTSNLSISNQTTTINLTITNAASSGLPQLVANYTFASSNEGFTLNNGWQWDGTNGWITYNGTDFGSNMFSPNASLKNYTNGYNITIVFTTGNITNTKFYFASAGTSTNGDKYHFERHNETHQRFKHDSVGYSQTDNYQNGVQHTIRISVNVTGNTTRACRVGGSCSNNEGIGSTSFGDYIAIGAGTMNGKNTLNITTIEIWRTG